MLREMECGRADDIAVVFTVHHARTMLRHRIIQGMIRLDVEPDESVIAAIMETAWPGLRIGLTDGEPDLFYGSKAPGVPIDWALESEIKQLCIKR